MRKKNNPTENLQSRSYKSFIIDLPSKYHYVKIVLLSPLIPMLLFLIPAFLGIDFGYHWDENYGKIRSLVRALEDGIFLQGEYMYSGFNFILTCIPLVPELAKMFWNGSLDAQHVREQLVPLVISEHYKILARGVFIVFTSLTIPGVYLISMALEKNRFQAFLASLAIAASWEYNYHSRWIAPDCILATIGTYAFLLLIITLKSQGLSWRKPLFLSAFLAGIAAGTKFPGGFLLLPVIGVGLFFSFSNSDKRVKSALKNSIIIFALFCLAFYLTTPAILIQPFVFFEDVATSIRNYQKGWSGLTINPGPEHFFSIIRYLSRDFFSHFQPIAYVFFGFSIVGIYRVVKTQSRILSCIIISAPLCYLIYFSNQCIMTPRNYLLVTPILAVLCGAGLQQLFLLLKPRLESTIFATILIIAFGINFLWLFESANSITKRTARRHEMQQPPENYTKALIVYIKNNPTINFIPSKLMRQDLKVFNADTLPNIGAQLKNPEDVLVCYQSESAMLAKVWPSTGKFAFKEIFGPQAANLQYYTKFWGAEWIFLIPQKNFKWLPEFLPLLVDQIPPPPVEDRLTHARWGFTHGL